MGHRALVAYERDDGTYALHYSHWGAAGFGLRWAVTPTTPFGGDDPERRVDSEPTATGLALEGVLAGHLDFQLYEAFYVVARDGAVTATLPLWFGLDDASRTVERSETVGNGALVPVLGPDVEPADPDRLRGWFRGTKGALGLLVDHGYLEAPGATELLVDLVRRRFHRREVRIVTAD